MYFFRNASASLKHLLSSKDAKEAGDNAIINQQILTLNIISTKLSHAYKGLDVEWEDSGKYFIFYFCDAIILICDYVRL